MIEQRNYGIDFLRIITMIGVITLHILGHGGILNNATNSIHFYTAWMLEIIAYPAVNCFLLISGFVGCKRTLPSFKSVAMLYLTVLFYSSTIFAATTLIYQQHISIKEAISAILPITTNQYWFFTCYMGMMVFTPIVNVFVNKTEEKTLKKIGLIIFLVFSIYSSFSMHYNTLFKLNDGYSILWFITLYTLGAIIKKTEFYKKISLRTAIISIIAATSITWIVKINTMNGASELQLNLSKSLVNYISPTVVITSIMLICIFVKIIIKNKYVIRIISTLSTSVFSVYLIHDNSYIRNNIIKKSFVPISSYHPLKMVLCVLAIAVSVFTIGILVDKIRIAIFKVLHIEKICDAIQNKCKRTKLE